MVGSNPASIRKRRPDSGRLFYKYRIRSELSAAREAPEASHDGERQRNEAGPQGVLTMRTPEGESRIDQKKAARQWTPFYFNFRTSSPMISSPRRTVSSSWE